MAQPQATADPSMEEILASIRKIISEDGDNARPAQPHLAVVPGSKNAQRPRGDEPPGVPEDTHAEAAYHDEPEFSEPPYSDAEDPGPQDFEGQFDAEASDPDAEPVAEFGEADAELSEETEPEAEPIWHAPDYDEPVARDEAPAEAEEPESDYAERAAPSLDALAAAMAAADRRSTGPGDRRLLSPRADEAVQSAFNQLADIILSEQTRALEDLVKDMMQPMLRHWLDDNLPVLVERLVREEIERVSRGRR
jgi:cell pole-organizing protein PopZ